MAAENNGGADFWGTNLINPDKSASPLLDQLCLGIARLIVRSRFAPCSGQELTKKGYIGTPHDRSPDTAKDCLFLPFGWWEL